MSAPRKSRSERFGISPHGVGGGKSWSPSEKIWKEFQQEASLEPGKKFNDEFRTAVRTAVGEYLFWEPFEHDAPAKGDFVKKVVKARKLTAELVALIDEIGDSASIFALQWRRHFSPRAPNSEGSSSVAMDNDGALLEQIQKESLLEYQRGFSGTLNAIQRVLDDTLMDAMDSSGNGVVGGAAWTRFVTDLAAAFETVPGLKITASKDVNRPLSPFVRFVKAVQSTLPPESRRHPSDAAISLAIWNVLKVKEKPQKRENSSRVSRPKSPPKHGKRAQIS